MERLHSKDLITLEGISREELELLFSTADTFREFLDRPIRKLPTLRGKTILNMFFEASTRTQASFDLAAKRLSADTVSVSKKGSSVEKGETLLDTLRNIEAMKIDAVVIRHSAPGAPLFLARNTSASVINAGDGLHEHPTQALLDMFTLRREMGDFAGKRILITGDILHSRVARSNIFGMRAWGAYVVLCGPRPLVPEDFRSLGAEVSWNLAEEIPKADVIMALRIQNERLSESYFPSIREFRRLFGITADKISLAKENVILMHPGPVNWEVELDPRVTEMVKTVILDQVTNGVAIRMAVFYLLIAGAREEQDGAIA
ncbi:MAG: aspartate carbamoyltransferase catalytic subunit [candidate division WOR-3 bacterium]